MKESGIRAARLFVFGVVVAGMCVAQPGAIDPAARKDIEAGNQVWATGMKQGKAAPIAATYAENAVDCTAAGECLKGRAAIEKYFAERMAKNGRATSAVATSLGSVQQGDFVYEWGRAQLGFAGSTSTPHRYLTVWQRQPDGAWKIFRNMPIPDDAPR
jgi:ketosteroid isomerase-like protein